MDQVGAGELGGLDVEEGAGIHEPLGRTHEGVEGDDLVAAHRFQHLDQVGSEAGVEIDALSDLVLGRRCRG